MKTNINKPALVLLALGICACSIQARAQTATTVTTTRGAFSEYVPGSETLVVKTNANPDPVQYVVTKRTTVVDETGAPVAINQLTLGAPLSVQYTEDGNRLVASHVVVEHAPTAVTGANVVQQETTTTTTRPLTHDEREALKEREKHRKKAAKEEIERRKDELDKAKDALDHDNGGN